MSDPPLPPKKDVAMALLKGPSLYVHLDPRGEDAIVPKWFKKQHQLVLQIGINMAVTIPDLDVGDDGIVATLSFNRSPFWCFMPWTAIYALVGEDGRGMVWPEDVPSELTPKTQKPSLKVVGSKKPKKKPAKSAAETTASPVGEERPKLAVAPAPVEVDEPAAEKKNAEDEGKSKLPPYLRVVK